MKAITSIKSCLFAAFVLANASPNAVASTLLTASTFQDSPTGVLGRTTVVTTHNSNLTPYYLATTTNATTAQVYDNGGEKSLGIDRFQTVGSNFAPTSLLDGERIELTLDYHYAATPSGTLGFRIMLYSHNTAPALTSDVIVDSPDRALYTGYIFAIGTAQESATANTIIYERPSGSTLQLSSGNGPDAIGLSSTNGVASGILTHQIKLTLTRNGSALDFQIFVDGNLLIARTDTISPFFDFDTLMFSNQDGTASNRVFIDNISLQIIPEPGSATLVGAALFLLTIFCFRRRRLS